jgi:hypothetical protein
LQHLCSIAIICLILSTAITAKEKRMNYLHIATTLFIMGSWHAGCSGAEGSTPQRVAITFHGPDRTRTGHFNPQHVDANSGRSLMSHLDDLPGILASVSYRSEAEPSKVLHKIKEGRALYAQLQAGEVEHANVIDVRYYLVDQEPNGAIVGRYIDPNINDYSPLDTEKRYAHPRLSSLLKGPDTNTALIHYIEHDAVEPAVRLYERAFPHAIMGHKCQMAFQIAHALLKKEHYGEVITCGLKLLHDPTIEAVGKVRVLWPVCRAYVARKEWHKLIETGTSIFELMGTHPNPTEVEILQMLAEAYKQTGSVDRAANCYHRAGFPGKARQCLEEQSFEAQKLRVAARSN